MYPTQSNYGRGSRAYFSNSSSFFLRLLHCKRTCAKRRRFFVNIYRSTQYHHVELGQNMERIEDKKSKSLNVNNIPLNEEEHKSWLEFKKIDEGKPVLDRINSEIANKAKTPIIVDHPFVPVIGDFAIGAFNELCEMHVKKGESNNLRHHEVMECTYLKHPRFYCFCMTIEAIEEGILGVYETIVACNPIDGYGTSCFKCFWQPVLDRINSEIANKAKTPIIVDHPFVPVIGDFAIGAFNELCEMHVKKEAIEEGILGVYETIVACNPIDGRRTLIEFSLSSRKPIGKIAKILPHLICLKSKYKTMKGMKKDIEIKLKTNRTITKGMNKVKVTNELICLKQRHKAMKGVCNLLYQNICMQIPTSWNERSNPDGWCVPNDRISGLRWRCHGATCKGYNYNTPSKDAIDESWHGLFGRAQLKDG
nr:hypothetical protein [Tanacetum cinerariifolium]